jgi:membrane dipeptidase
MNDTAIRSRFSVRRTFLPFAAIALLATWACGGGEPADSSMGETEAELVERARGIHDRVITLDTHDDISPANFTAERNYTTDLGNQVNLPKMEAGGLDVAWLVVYVGQGELTDEGFDDAYAQAIEKFDAIHRLTEEIAPDRIELAVTSDDVRRIVASGKKVAMIGIENGFPVGEDIGRVQEFAERGGRYMSPRPRGHRRDEPLGDHDRPLASLEGGDARDDGAEPCTGHRLPLGCPGPR